MWRVYHRQAGVLVRLEGFDNPFETAELAKKKVISWIEDNILYAFTPAMIRACAPLIQFKIDELDEEEEVKSSFYIELMAHGKEDGLIAKIVSRNARPVVHLKI